MDRRKSCLDLVDKVRIVFEFVKDFNISTIDNYFDFYALIWLTT